MSYLFYGLLNLLSVFVLVLLVLVGVAFLTLLERKVLGYIQDRKGPNKVGFMGMLQPFSEVIKLFSKEVLVIYKSMKWLFFLSPILSMLLLLLVFLSYPYFTNIYFLNYSMLFVIVVLSLNSYLIMMMGWSSSSLYSMLGAIRSVAQMLSYEVSFIMIILVQLILSESYSLVDLFEWQIYMWFFWVMIPLVIVFFISILSELNRSPMDFVEGESELVSGFNIEYFSGSFALIFLAEYGMIIFMSILMAGMYFGSKIEFVMMILVNLMILFIVFMRGILPRMRYDELMYLCWKIILPMILNYLAYFMFFKVMFTVMI